MQLRYFGTAGEIVRDLALEWADVIARLGAAGWELAGIGAYEILYFKRLIEPGQAIDDAL
jgi:hypothetical protein